MISSVRRELQLLQLAACCLCMFAACASAESITDCNGKWWYLTNQKIAVRNPSLGTTYVGLQFDEVFWSGSTPLIRQTKVNGQKLVIFSSGWVQIYSNSNKYMVPENANFRLGKSEAFIIFSKFRANLEGKLKMGYNLIEVGDVRYEYTVTHGGWCRS